MKITHDVRELSESALAGMAAKAEEFRAKGGEIYV
jgi:hypothetical protein